MLKFVFTQSLPAGMMAMMVIAPVGGRRGELVVLRLDKSWPFIRSFLGGCGELDCRPVFGALGWLL